LALIRFLVNLVVPVAVFIFSAVILWLLLRFALDKIESWTKKHNHPVFSSLYSGIKRSAIVFLLLISAHAGLLAAPWSGGWGYAPPNALLSFAILAVMLTLLNILQSLASFYGQRLNLPGATRAIQVSLVIIVLVLTVLVLLLVWGAETSPLLIFIAGLTVLLLLALRDTGPDYAAALQLAMWKHIGVGESIKLQNGLQGIISKLNWQNIEVLTPEGNLVIIPNSRFIKEVVTRFIDSPEAVKTSVDFLQHQTPVPVNEPDQPEPISVIASILSKRELEIAELVSQGATNKELASKLFISEHTVKVHVKNILQKLELKNRQQIAVLAATQSKKAK